jgi:hypothetical protein
MENKKAITVANGAQAMCNNNGSTAFHGSVESLLHDLLTFLVQGTGGLVKNEDLRIFYQGSCNGDALFLPAR